MEASEANKTESNSPSNTMQSKVQMLDPDTSSHLPYSQRSISPKRNEDQEEKPIKTFDDLKILLEALKKHFSTICPECIDVMYGTMLDTATKAFQAKPCPIFNRCCADCYNFFRELLNLECATGISYCLPPQTYCKQCCTFCNSWNCPPCIPRQCPCNCNCYPCRPVPCGPASVSCCRQNSRILCCKPTDGSVPCEYPACCRQTSKMVCCKPPDECVPCRSVPCGPVPCESLPCCRQASRIMCCKPSDGSVPCGSVPCESIPCCRQSSRIVCCKTSDCTIKSCRVTNICCSKPKRKGKKKRKSSLVTDQYKPKTVLVEKHKHLKKQIEKVKREIANTPICTPCNYECCCESPVPEQVQVNDISVQTAQGSEEVEQ